MTKLRVFIWNDNTEQLSNWMTIAKNAGYLPDGSSSIDIRQVGQTVTDTYYDLVIVDVIFKRRTHGLSIARDIRKRDPLIPIIAITRFPELVYQSQEGNLEDIGLCGFFDAKIMDVTLVENLRVIAVRPSLTQWQSTYPEFALIRRCVWGIRNKFKNSDISHLTDRVCNCLYQIASSRSIESWHKQVSEVILDLLNERGLDTIHNTYQRIISIFQISDPFFMAANLGRRHISHNIQVFLLGTILLLEDTDIKNEAIKCMADIRQQTDNQYALLDSILLWACISSTHDVGYFSQYLEMISEKIVTASELFRPIIEKISGEMINPYSKWKWPEIHHALVGDKAWRFFSEEYTKNERDNKIIDIICNGISRHDSSRAVFTRVGAETWASFLAVLCDELQDWHRERHEASPGLDPKQHTLLRAFAIERFGITKAETGSIKLELDFVAKDYPKFVRDHIGKPGREVLVKRFQGTLDILKSNLYYPNRMEVSLSAEFVSREMDPVILSIDLPRAA